MGYNKKVLSKATSELGKAKKPPTPRDTTVDAKGYWNPANQNKSKVKVPGNQITMGPNPETGEPIPFPIYGVPNIGIPQMMYPGNKYYFPGADNVVEHKINPESLIMAKGGSDFSTDINKRRQILRDLTYGENIGMLQEKQQGGNQGHMILDLTPEEIEEYKKGGYIIEHLDPSIPELTHAQEGVSTEPELTYEAPETFAYENKEAEKKHKALLDKARALMDTAQGRKLWYNELKPKDFTIKELSRFVKGVGDYNKEAQAYEKAKRRLEEGKISTDTYGQLYRQRGWSQFDPNTMREGYKGQWQEAATEAQKRKEKNMGVTNAFLELTGAPALQRIASDPLGTAKGIGTTALDVAAAASPLSYINPTQPNINPLTGEQYWSGLGKTLDVAGIVPIFGAAGKLAKAADIAGDATKIGKYLTTQTPLRNTYKYNPRALKENPEMYLYRTQPENFVAGITEEEQLKSLITDKIIKGEEVPWYLKGKLWKIQNAPEPYRNALNEYHGQWFDKDPARMDFYIKERLDGDPGNILRLKVPKKIGEQYNLKNFPEAQKASLNYESEFIVPREKLTDAQKFNTTELQKLIEEDKTFNTPHWLKGYGQQSLPKINLSNYLPQYKNVYRVEPTTFTKDVSDQLSGRWMGELAEMPFYVRNLKDPNAGVRIMRHKLPVKTWESISGHNMPEEAKMFSAGTGEYNTIMDAVKAGEISAGAAKRLQAGVPISSDLIELSTNPNLINLNEGIITEQLANKLRTLDKNRLLSRSQKVEYPAGDVGREGAFDYLYNITDVVEKPILGIPRSYFPFDDGGVINEEEGIFMDIDNEDDIQKYIDEGYIVEYVND